MHGKKFLISELRFGTNGDKLFVRLDFTAEDFAPTEVRLTVRPEGAGAGLTVLLTVSRGGAAVAGPSDGVECAYRRVLELAVPLGAAGVPPRGRLRFQCSLWQNGLPVDTAPHHGWIELESSDPAWYE
jgi:hypothetical protein